MEKIRLPVGWRSAVDTGRLLLISPFEDRPRPTIESAQRRNEIVAALAD
jgi:predicted Rossmann fold nucleotide-binding protein DprA/Smf involved in DNA uptake